SLRRMVLVRNPMVEIYADSRNDSAVIALAERYALLELESCPKNWCQVSTEQIKGWIKRQDIWGVRADESLE
ncbi:MAG: SH3 domain-containing protein, partial [Candidatus Puniceispirillum sp.]